MYYVNKHKTPQQGTMEKQKTKEQEDKYKIDCAKCVK